MKVAHTVQLLFPITVADIRESNDIHDDAVISAYTEWRGYGSDEAERTVGLKFTWTTGE